MAGYKQMPTTIALSSREMRSSADLGARVRKLPKDYKTALAMAIAGKTNAEILGELKPKDLDEAGIKKKMEELLVYLRVDSFEDGALQARPVRRALRDFWIYDFGPE